ncbi:hypothetical protein E2562_031739 [Oryza meyeriana var. granulata]|uniref:Uncharacterized protein n=1 Tax=Oryza meyeriana var. granulata TaxID=110450 RepID=A0A6G1CV98_9ORYZ|nr:hypothetical protein E2562_031739 [Oryza meyeriana var. granulata]
MPTTVPSSSTSAVVAAGMSAIGVCTSDASSGAKLEHVGAAATKSSAGVQVMPVAALSSSMSSLTTEASVGV